MKKKKKNDNFLTKLGESILKSKKKCIVGFFFDFKIVIQFIIDF